MQGLRNAAREEFFEKAQTMNTGSSFFVGLMLLCGGPVFGQPIAGDDTRTKEEMAAWLSSQGSRLLAASTRKNPVISGKGHDLLVAAITQTLAVRADCGMEYRYSFYYRSAKSPDRWRMSAKRHAQVNLSHLSSSDSLPSADVESWWAIVLSSEQARAADAVDVRYIHPLMTPGVHIVLQFRDRSSADRVKRVLDAMIAACNGK